MRQVLDAFLPLSVFHFWGTCPWSLVADGPNHHHVAIHATLPHLVKGLAAPEPFLPTTARGRQGSKNDLEVNVAQPVQPELKQLSPGFRIHTVDTQAKMRQSRQRNIPNYLIAPQLPLAELHLSCFLVGLAAISS